MLCRARRVGERPSRSSGLGSQQVEVAAGLRGPGGQEQGFVRRLRGPDAGTVGRADQLRALALDFDEDGDVDGRDFLKWQRGESPMSLSAGDLNDWQTNYGMSGGLAAVGAVPEPSSFVLVGTVTLLFLNRKR